MWTDVYFLMARAQTYERELKRRASDSASAQKNNKKSCQKCGFCCWKRPCSLVKSDVTRIAEYLGITETELFQQYLVVDEIDYNLVVLPRRKEQEDIAGKYVPNDRTYDIYTPCVFLRKDNTCEIHPVKPLGGKEHKCWTDVKVSDYGWSKQDVEALGWDGDRY